MTTLENKITPSDFEQRIKAKETFVLNIVAAWCSDCTEQQQSFPCFAELLNNKGVDVVQINAQQEKLVFISKAHEELINGLGGHGYPRTVLVKDGIVLSTENVEVISKEALVNLASYFGKML